MIAGIVSGRHVLVTVTLQPPGQSDIGIEFIIDTGFAGFIALPPSAVAALRLPFLHRMPANTADNRSILVDVHQAVIIWNGVERTVEALSMGKLPLIGVSLLDGFRLDIEFVENGPVRIY